MNRTGARLRGLYGIVGPPDGSDCDDKTLLARTNALLAAGCPVLQLRHKQAPDGRLITLARELTQRAHAAGALLIVNDRLDLALIAGADGVHLGQTDLPVAEAREVARRTAPDFIIGLSTHDLEQVVRGTATGADYLGFGPVFPTTSKETAPVQGPAQLARAVKAAGATPVVAIGGVCLENAPSVSAAGAAMGAVISDVARAADPYERAKQLHAALGGQACVLK